MFIHQRGVTSCNTPTVRCKEPCSLSVKFQKSLMKNFKFSQQKLRVIHIAEGRRTSPCIHIQGREDKEADEVYIAHKQINPFPLQSISSLKLCSNIK